MNYRWIILLSALLVAMLYGPALWAAGPFLDEYDDTEDMDVKDPKAWKEGKVALPPYPKDEDLLEFPVEADTGAVLTYFVDSKSLSVGDDGAVRYVLVIVAAQGAKNVMFEGMRCDANEYKTYAFGSGKGKFHKLRNPEWKLMRGTHLTPYRKRLKDHYLCHPEYPVAREPKAIIEALKYQDQTDRDCTLCD